MTYEEDAYYINVTTAVGRDIENLLDSKGIEYETTTYSDEMPYEVPNHVYDAGEMEINHVQMFKSKTDIIPIVEAEMKERFSAFQCGYAYKGFEYVRPELPKEDMDRINKMLAELKNK